MPRFTAEVQIERPARYGKQLASHLGHKAPVTELENGWSLAIGTGTGLVLPSESILTLDRKSTRLNSVTLESRMPSSA